MSDPLTIAVSERARVSARLYHAVETARAGATFVLAHGAGAGQSSPFMVRFATALAARGLDVLTFNFLYTEERRRGPDRNDTLESCYRAVIASARGIPALGGNAMFIGGKSMGGRIASQVAAGEDGATVSGLIFLGYPLHPPGQPQRLRAVHLASIRAPMLFIQGSRDAFGRPEELQPILDRLPASVTLHVVQGGDHSLASPKKGHPSVEQVEAEVQDTIIAWIRAHLSAD